MITHCNLEGFDIDDIYVGNPSWMEYRLDMFEKYTLASLMNQTDPEFRSIVGHGFDKIESDRDFLFLDAFAWHWHNSSNKDRDIQEGSKFDLLRKRTDKLLKERGIL